MCPDCLNNFRALANHTGSVRAEWCCTVCGPQEYDSDECSGAVCSGVMLAVAVSVLVAILAAQMVFGS